MSALLPFLRPSAARGRMSSIARPSHLQFYNCFQNAALADKNHKKHEPRSQKAAKSAETAPQSPISNPRIRVGNNKEGTYNVLWPRMPKQENAVDIKQFRLLNSDIRRGDTIKDEEVTVRGRIWSIRTAGSKLAFLELAQERFKLQCVVNFQNMADDSIKGSTFKSLLGDLNRGDIISVTGQPHRTKSAELSILATEMPALLARCQRSLPEKITDQETKIRSRSVNLLLNRRASDILCLRSELLRFLRQYFLAEGFVDVQTPILANSASGAIARPFKTYAAGFRDSKVELRIAPELWLKKMIVGGFDKVFEIGPCFRNEGIDLNHNPEFWTCEFYKTYADLDELIWMTEHMLYLFSGIARDLEATELSALEWGLRQFQTPFRQLDFIPVVEATLGSKMPDLSLPGATAQVTQLLVEHGIPIPTRPNLPRLLDQLSSRVLEPQCEAPTWIINYPECMSPLSKSFTHPQNGQVVAARGELFIKTQELVNTYEEENSPIEQRRKFESQLAFNDPEDPRRDVDEDYIRTLAWGMPPTGGWGCGIDRLVMLFAGTNRIADTLSFGTLKNVIAKPQSDTKVLPHQQDLILPDKGAQSKGHDKPVSQSLLSRVQS